MMDFEGVGAAIFEGTAVKQAYTRSCLYWVLGLGKPGRALINDE